MRAEEDPHDDVALPLHHLTSSSSTTFYAAVSNYMRGPVEAKMLELAFPGAAIQPDEQGGRGHPELPVWPQSRVLD